MNIYLICQQAPRRHALPAYDFWAGYFRAGLAEAGHGVQETPEVDWARGLLPLPASERAAWRTDAWTRTVAAAREARAAGRLDVVLSYLYPEQIEASAVRTIRGLGLPWVNFFCDHLREYRTVPDAFAVFDLNWVPEYAALAWYRRRDWPALHAAMPCWVPPERRQPPESELAAMSFIGRRDPLRAALFEAAARAGLPLEVRGAGWLAAEDEQGPAGPPATWADRGRDWADFVRRQGWSAGLRRVSGRFRAAKPSFDFAPFARPSPDAAGYQEILATSAVSLGVNRFPSLRFPAGRPPAYSRLRDIEGPMLGACYLTEWAEGLDRLYDLEAEISVYRTAEELAGQARALLADASRRRRLRSAGQRRALAEHTIGATMVRIGRHFGLSPASQ